MWRHNNIDLDNRLCEKCRVIEDEEHFLTQCTKYNEKKRNIILGF